MRQTPAANARSGRWRTASGRDLNQREAARLPVPIPVRTTESINAKASVPVTTNIERNRNQTTSSASRDAPERNAATRIRLAENVSRGVTRLPSSSEEGKGEAQPRL